MIGYPCCFEIYQEYCDGEPGAWIGAFPPLNLLSQGDTPEEAEAAIKEALVSWSKAITDCAPVRRAADRHWKSVDRDGETVVTGGTACPPDIEVTAEMGERLLDMIENPREPTPALRALMRGDRICPVCGKEGCCNADHL